MITIDGNYLEGGGQIVRTALALSTVTGLPFSVTGIRTGRKNPGLKAQHLHGVKALEALCHASSTGAELASTSLQYQPGTMEGRTLPIDIGTAGSIGLLMQTLLLPCCFSDSKVRLKITGGTDTRWSMPFDYVVQVLLPVLNPFADFKVELLKRGYYPKGGGKVDITITPKIHRDHFASPEDFITHLRLTCPPFNMTDPGTLLHIKGVSHASEDLKRGQVAERQAKAAKLDLRRPGVKIDISSQYHTTDSTGSGVVLWAEFSHSRLGADALGDRGIRAETVGQDAAQQLNTAINSNTPVDKHLCDNLIPFLGLVGGQIKTSEVTDHALTNIYVTEQFLPVKFDVSGNTIMVVPVNFMTNSHIGST